MKKLSPIITLGTTIILFVYQQFVQNYFMFLGVTIGIIIVNLVNIILINSEQKKCKFKLAFTIVSIIVIIVCILWIIAVMSFNSYK